MAQKQNPLLPNPKLGFRTYRLKCFRRIQVMFEILASVWAALVSPPRVGRALLLWHDWADRDLAENQTTDLPQDCCRRVGIYRTAPTWIRPVSRDRVRRRSAYRAVAHRSCPVRDM